MIIKLKPIKKTFVALKKKKLTQFPQDFVKLFLFHFSGFEVSLQDQSNPFLLATKRKKVNPRKNIEILYFFLIPTCSLTTTLRTKD